MLFSTAGESINITVPVYIGMGSSLLGVSGQFLGDTDLVEAGEILGWVSLALGASALISSGIGLRNFIVMGEDAAKNEQSEIDSFLSKNNLISKNNDKKIFF